MGAFVQNWFTLIYFFSDIKIIILGDSNVGKTCLLQRYMTGEFSDTLAVSHFCTVQYSTVQYS